ncbi:helix-turn-helix domain-containing protein [Flavobacterium hibisci]|uniref:helix-turn-helix domain-containing protein n=1 Tax=Flavobacterium hibisci TaxID=1914462 RepID=UPI001CC015DB|nr:helix-turn-helix transcriptional regulator [Flavobacterium hibisci]MBZ4042596.1 helix-turn-helix domain-containing protein [Flavobacterium hibisci]
MMKFHTQEARIIIGQTFKLFRKEKNLMIGEVAVFCGVTSDIINKIEQGKLSFSIDLLLKLSVILDYTIFFEQKEKGVQNRFLLQKGKKPGYFIATDKVNEIVCSFKAGNFNKTQNFTFLNDKQIPNLATVMRELGDWLVEHHPDKV